MFFLLTVAMCNSGGMLKELVLLLVSYLLHRSTNIKLSLLRKKKTLCENHIHPSVRHSCDILAVTKALGLTVTPLSIEILCK